MSHEEDEYDELVPEDDGAPELPDDVIAKMEQDKEGLQEDFVEYWKKTLDKKTDAHWLFKELSALFLISTVTRWNWYFLDPTIEDDMFGEYEQQRGGRLFNLWVCFIGKSRLARKSTVISFVERMLGRVGYRFEVEDEGIVTLRLPDDFNPSTFVAELALRNLMEFGRFHWATWIEDEVSRFFEQMAKGNYMAGMAPVLAKIYDPYKSYSRITRAHGREHIERVYLTMLLASTEALPQLFTDYQIRQGFLNRIMFILCNLKEKEPRQKGQVSYNEFIAMAEWLAGIRDTERGVTLAVAYNSPEEKYIEEFEAYIDSLIIEDKVDEFYQGYLGNLPSFLIQLACLYRISRIPYYQLEPLALQSYVILPVEMQDLERARKIVDIVWENFKQVVRIAKTRTSVVQTFTQDSNQIVVYDAIENCVDKSGWANRTDVLRKSRLTSRILDEVLNDLAQIGCVKIKYDQKVGAKKRIQLIKPIFPPF